LRNMKKICFTFVLFCTFLCLCACNAENKNDKTVAAGTVNGEIITADELQYFKGKLKAQVMNDILQEFSAEYTPGFWTEEFDGKTPEKVLYDQAFEKCVTAKIQFVLMREKGVYPDISYRELYNKAVAFNKENSKKQGVVGLKSIKLEQFYSYYLDNGIMELKNILAKDEIKPSAGEIKERVKQLTDSVSNITDDELLSVAKSELISEKYDAYIAALRSSAKISTAEQAGG